MFINDYKCVFYLGAQAYSTLKQLTEPRNQLSQHRNIKVLKTLNTKTDPYKTFLFLLYNLSSFKADISKRFPGHLKPKIIS